MANDILGGLGGLFKGLSGIMPQDDPSVKLLNATTSVSDLKKQESELYAKIGRQAIERYGADAFGDDAAKLRLVQNDIRTAQQELDALNAENERKEREAKEAKAALTCPSCGTVNPEGVKFCQECGSKVGAPASVFCGECGAKNAPGVRFCGECGARIGG